MVKTVTSTAGYLSESAMCRAVARSKSPSIPIVLMPSSRNSVARETGGVFQGPAVTIDDHQQVFAFDPVAGFATD